MVRLQEPFATYVSKKKVLTKKFKKKTEESKIAPGRHLDYPKPRVISLPFHFLAKCNFAPPHPRRRPSHRQPSSTNSIMQMRRFRQHANVGTPFSILPHPSQKPWFGSRRNHTPDKVPTRKKVARRPEGVFAAFRFFKWRPENEGLIDIS